MPKKIEQFAVWGDCWDAVTFFCACEPCWRFISNMEKTVRIGLDRCQVQTEMQLQGITKKKKQQALWADLRVMESAALSVLNKDE